MRPKLPQVLVNKYQGVSEFAITKSYDGIYINFYNIKQDHEFRRKSFPVINFNPEEGISIYVGLYYSRMLRIDTIIRPTRSLFYNNSFMVIDGLDIVEPSPWNIYPYQMIIK